MEFVEMETNQEQVVLPKRIGKKKKVVEKKSVENGFTESDVPQNSVGKENTKKQKKNVGKQQEIPPQRTSKRFELLKNIASTGVAYTPLQQKVHLVQTENRILETKTAEEPKSGFDKVCLTFRQNVVNQVNLRRKAEFTEALPMPKKGRRSFKN